MRSWPCYVLVVDGKEVERVSGAHDLQPLGTDVQSGGRRQGESAGRLAAGQSAAGAGGGESNAARRESRDAGPWRRDSAER